MIKLDVIDRSRKLGKLLSKEKVSRMLQKSLIEKLTELCQFH